MGKNINYTKTKIKIRNRFLFFLCQIGGNPDKPEINKSKSDAFKNDAIEIEIAVFIVYLHE